MCKYLSNCRQEHNPENHCFYCHGHKLKDCWYHCLEWHNFLTNHKGAFPKADPHNNYNCVHISHNAHSLLNECVIMCEKCLQETPHDRSRRNFDGFLVWKCSKCNNIRLEY